MLVVSVAVFGSGASPARAESPDGQQRPDTVATWNGGGVTFAELESGILGTQTPTCQGSSLGAWGDNPDGVTDCLEDVARRIALEELILRGIPDPRGAVARQGDPPGALLRRAFANTWRRWYAEETAEQITESDILIFYETHRDRYRQRGSVELWNIFRRQDQQNRSEETIAELLELKARIEGGTAFEEIAREYSQSETRTRGGLVGDVKRGQLPPDLEAIVFELDAGEISVPIPVAGGAVILQVRRVTEGSDLPFESVRDRVAGQIAAERRAAAVAEIVKGVDVPKGSIVLSREALTAVLDGADPDAPVLAVYDTTMTAGELRERERMTLGARVSELGAARRETLWNSYITMKNGALLGAALNEEADPKLRKAAGEAALEQGKRLIVLEVLHGEVESGPLDEAVLGRHFDENRDRFRVPLQIKLRMCEAPFGDDPVQRFAEMDDAYRELAAGSVALGEVCSGSGGRIAVLDWTTPQELSRRLHSKALSLVRALDVGGFTVPFQQSRSIVIVELLDRRPPREMSFDEAREKVSQEVAAVQGRNALRRAADERLRAAGFRFDRERVRAILTSSSSPPPSG